MNLKRKRSSPELPSSPMSFSSAFSSPPSNGPSMLDFTPRMGLVNPCHLNSRTLKRSRDNRPSQEEIHQRTLELLYNAQQQQQYEDLPSPCPDAEANPELERSQQSHNSNQQSLHRFWNIRTEDLGHAATAVTKHHQHLHVQICHTRNASSAREDLQRKNEIGTECSLKNGFQAGASREAPSPSNGSESTPMVTPTSDNNPVPRGGTIEEAIDRRRKEKGLPPIPRTPDRSGHMLLHSGFSRYVVLRPDNVVVKLGSYLNLDEMDAIAFAKGAGIRVPEVVGWGEQTTARK
ncbi:hypothetical protein LEL_00561 [Akanthomyces lecanii RCEF 1005]|uniref:Uncharacterized protein n=1 Tax=Akanthomyces lecanii RCEF 1005 TaxID=1081108 RepID=A0A162KLY9_CORDF|nr:hypothetical protein LEL_00561 [Akanthomyces lecanii RCEF 1005]